MCKHNQFCLCVGAGITSTFIGDWENLVNALGHQNITRNCSAEHISPHEIYSFFDEYEKKNNAPFLLFHEGMVLEVCDYLLNSNSIAIFSKDANEKVALQELIFAYHVDSYIKQQIEKNIHKPCEKNCNECKIASGKVKDVVDYIFTLMQQENKHYTDCKFIQRISTLLAVIRLCLSGTVTQVVTYNFDSILDECLADELIQKLAGNGRKYEIHLWVYGTKITEKQKNISMDNTKIKYHYGEVPMHFPTTTFDEDKTVCINLYHVHGMLGNVPKIQPVVFSGNTYNEYQEAALNWSQRILSELMHRYDMRTVGFSGVDKNFRKIAMQIKRDRESYIFGLNKNRKDEKSIILLLAEEAYSSRFQNISNITAREKEIVNYIVKKYKQMVESYYKQYFDISVLWFHSFKDIAIHLNKLAQGSKY